MATVVRMYMFVAVVPALYHIIQDASRMLLTPRQGTWLCWLVVALVVSPFLDQAFQQLTSLLHALWTGNSTLLSLLLSACDIAITHIHIIVSPQQQSLQSLMPGFTCPGAYRIVVSIVIPQQLQHKLFLLTSSNVF
jgi:fructose-specific phosphotransferase system IIC component